jgi:hypothetical protein
LLVLARALDESNGIIAIEICARCRIVGIRVVDGSKCGAYGRIIVFEANNVGSSGCDNDIPQIIVGERRSAIGVNSDLMVLDIDGARSAVCQLDKVWA